MLYLIGIGLYDEKDITVRGLEAIKACDFVYLENYTSKLSVSMEKLKEFYGKEVLLAEREFVEDGKEILDKAKEKDVALLVIGDVFGATTHVDLMLRAKQEDVEVRVIHNASVLTAVGVTGLSLYKFGKTTSIPFENENVRAPYDVLKENNGLHTLFLLDLKSDERFMRFNEAIEFLLRVSDDKSVFSEETLCVGCASLGGKNIIRVGKAKELVIEEVEEFPQCLIVPGKLHFMEEEFLNTFSL